MEPGELDALNAKHKAEPDRYIPDHDNDACSIATFSGVAYAWNCPCGALDRMESFIWNNRGRFMQFYRERSKRELEEANKTVEQIQQHEPGS